MNPMKSNDNRSLPAIKGYMTARKAIELLSVGLQTGWGVLDQDTLDALKLAIGALRVQELKHPSVVYPREPEEHNR